MNRRLNDHCGFWTVVVLALACLPTAALEAADQERDLQSVKRFLAEEFPDSKWSRGPTRMMNDAIATAYPTSRFYYVFSPQYPIARGGLTAMIRIARSGKAAKVSTPGSFNAGLMAVTNDDEARTAAAAIMSLTFGPFGPVAVAAGSVDVARDNGGWKCTSATDNQGQPTSSAVRAKGSAAPNIFVVRFDAGGKCIEAGHVYRGPLPICFGGLFRPAPLPTEIRCFGDKAGTALAVISIEPSSPAERAGMKPGDLVVSFDGRPLPGGDTIQRMRETIYPLKQRGNQERRVQVFRDGKLVDLVVRW